MATVSQIINSPFPWLQHFSLQLNTPPLSATLYNSVQHHHHHGLTHDLQSAADVNETNTAEATAASLTIESSVPWMEYLRLQPIMPYPAPHLNVVTEEPDEPTSTGNIETGHGDSVASNIPTTVHFVGS